MKPRRIQNTILFLLLLSFLAGFSACASSAEERLSSVRVALSEGRDADAAGASLGILKEGVSKEAAAYLREALEAAYEKEGPAGFLALPWLNDAVEALALYPAESRALDAVLTAAEGLSLYEEGRYEEALPLLRRSQGAEAGSALKEAEEILARNKAFAESARLKAEEKYIPAAEALSLYSDEEAENEKAALAKLEEERLDRLTEEYRTRFAAGAWYTVLLDGGARLAGDGRYFHDALPGDAVAVSGGPAAPVFLNRDGTVTLFSDTFGQSGELALTDVKAVSAGIIHLLVLKNDGTVETLGAKNEDLALAADWTDVVAVSAGAVHSLGLKSDGTVLAAGENTSRQCDVSGWRNVVAVSAGAFHSAALTADGRVLCTGDNAYGQCGTEAWENVRVLVTGPFCTAGITYDRKLLYAGGSHYGLNRMTELENVVAVAAGPFHAVVITGDGAMHAFGFGGNGQLGLLKDAAPSYPDTGAPPEYVYIGDSRRGPWFYLNPEGLVLITEDDTYGLGANRADLIAAEGTLPCGILSGGGDNPVGTLAGQKIARQNKAVFAVSGDYYAYTGNADGVQIRRGIIRHDGEKTRSAAFFPDGTMRLVDSAVMRAGELLSRGVKDVWSFGPVLVEDGALADFERHPLARSNEITLRSCVGTLGRNHHIVLTTGSGTIREIANLMLAFGCTDAYNLDGGRSVSMSFMGESIQRTLFDEYGTRHLQDMLAFLFSDSVPGVNDKYVNRKY